MNQAIQPTDMAPDRNKRKGRKKGRKKDQKPMLFSALNYRMMGSGVLLVIIGFTIMYLENEIHGFISLYISPILILTGYMIVLAAILKRDKKEQDLKPAAK